MTAPDVLVVGAGVFGLSVARSARRAGLTCVVLDARHPGAGASGGIVGALTPHAPSRWRAMMAFQFNALLSLPETVAALEAETGLSAGYRRSGRLTPIATEKARASAERDRSAAPEVWGDAARYEILDTVPPSAEGWITPEAAPFGTVHDTLSARIDPRAYVRALTKRCGECVRCAVRVADVDPVTDPDTASVKTSSGMMAAGHIVLAPGADGWPLIDRISPRHAGTGVKGQAALLGADAGEMPVIYQDGLYIIPHEGGRVAVGSTSEKAFTDPESVDDGLDAVLDRARAMCPALRTAPVLERWAALRPKPPGREPQIGPLPGHPKIWLATGGFKISFGIAHAVGDAVIAGILGETPPIALPETFAPTA